MHLHLKENYNDSYLVGKCNQKNEYMTCISGRQPLHGIKENNYFVELFDELDYKVRLALFCNSQSSVKGCLVWGCFYL